MGFSLCTGLPSQHHLLPLAPLTAQPSRLLATVPHPMLFEASVSLHLQGPMTIMLVPCLPVWFLLQDSLKWFLLCADFPHSPGQPGDPPPLHGVDHEDIYLHTPPSKPFAFLSVTLSGCEDHILIYFLFPKCRDRKSVV